MLLIKTLKIYIDNHSEIPYQPQKTQNNHHKLYQKNACNKIKASQRIRKLNTKKKMLIQEPSFKLLGRNPLAICICYAHINITWFFLEEYNTPKNLINKNKNLTLGI